MIQARTLINVADNSGAQTVRCIKVLGGFKKKYAGIGDVVIVSVHKIRNRLKRSSKVKRKEIYKALVLRTKVYIRRDSGVFLKFDENAVALINKRGNPIGTRIIGAVPRELVRKKYQRFISISPGIV